MAERVADDFAHIAARTKELTAGEIPAIDMAHERIASSRGRRSVP